METQSKKGRWKRYGHVRNEATDWLSWTVSIATDHVTVNGLCIRPVLT